VFGVAKENGLSPRKGVRHGCIEELPCTIRGRIARVPFVAPLSFILRQSDFKLLAGPQTLLSSPLLVSRLKRLLGKLSVERLNLEAILIKTNVHRLVGLTHGTIVSGACLFLLFASPFYDLSEIGLAHFLGLRLFFKGLFVLHP